MTRVSRTGLAVLGASALALSGILFATPHAFAATYVVSEDDVYPYRDSHPLAETFHHWHVSTNVLSDDNLAEDQHLDDHFLFGECSVQAFSDNDDETVKGMIKGLKAHSDYETSVPRGKQEILDFLDSVSLEVLSGSAGLLLQFEILQGWIEYKPIMQMQLSPAGTVTLSGPLDYVSTSQLSSFPDGLTIEEFLDYVEENYQSSEWYVDLVAVGFAADASQGSEVSSITFGGNTYLFGNNCGDVGEEGGDGNGDGTGDGSADGSPTPPDKVDTSFGSDSLAITLIVAGTAIAAAALSIRRRSQTE